MSLNDHIYRCVLFLERNNNICDQTFRYKDKFVKVVKVIDRNKTVRGYHHFVTAAKKKNLSV